MITWNDLLLTHYAIAIKFKRKSIPGWGQEVLWEVGTHEYYARGYYHFLSITELYILVKCDQNI